MRFPSTSLTFAATTLALMLAGGCLESPPDPPARTLALTEAEGLPAGGNALKLFDVDLDPVRRRIYVSSILTPFLAVLDADSGQPLGWVDTGLTGYHLPRLAVDEASGLVYVLETESGRLVEVDPASGGVTGRALEFGTSASGVAVAAGRVLVTIAHLDEVRIHRISDLAFERTFGAADGISGPQGMAVSDGQVLVATSAGVAVLDPAAGSGELVRAAVPGAIEVAVDLETRRYWLATDHKVVALDGRGSVLASRRLDPRVENIVHLPGLDLLAVLTEDGGMPVGRPAVVGSIEFLDPDTLESRTAVTTGMKSARLAFDEGRDRLFVAEMGEGSVSVVDVSSSGTIGVEATIDVSAAIEALAVHPDDTRVYLLSRLGGSVLHVHEPATGSLKTIAMDPWPVEMIVHPGRRELLVFCQFSSTVLVVDLRRDAVVARIDLTRSGVAPCVTHYLASLALDEARDRLYVSIPEQGRLVSIDVAGRRVETVASIFDPISQETDEGTEVGRYQLAVDAADGRLYAWLRDERELRALDETFAVRSTLRFRASDFADNDFEAHLLALDPAGRRLFVGPHVVSLAGSAPARVGLLSGVECVASTSGEAFLGVEADDDGTIRLRAIDPGTLETGADLEAAPCQGIVPRVAASSGTGEVYLGYMTEARLDVVLRPTAP